MKSTKSATNQQPNKKPSKLTLKSKITAGYSRSRSR